MSTTASPQRRVHTLPSGITIEARLPEAPSARDVALRYAEKGLWQPAVAELEKVLRSNPNDAEAHGLLGSIHLAQDRYDDAVRELEEASKLEPDRAWWQFKLGVAYEWRKDPEQARRHLDAALELDPDFAEVHAELGQLNHDAGRPDAAVAEWEKAVSLGSEVAEANYNLGAHYLSLDRVEEAVPLLQTATRTGTPQVAGLAHFALGLALQKLGHDTEAVRAELVKAAELGNDQAIEILRG